MENSLFIVIEVKDDKTIKKGNWQIRLENLIKEYFKIKKFTYYWNPFRSEQDG